MRGLVWFGVLAAAGLVGCGQASEDAPPQSGGGVVLDENDAIPGLIVEGDISLELPSGWVRAVPTSSMRAHQFVVGGADESGVTAVGAVFTTIGGSVESNLTRWEGQLSGEGVEIEREIVTAEGRSVAAFVGRGTFDAGRAMGSTGPRDGWVVLGLIVETGTDKPFVLKVDGPATVLDGQMSNWEALLASLRVGGETVFGGGGEG